MEQYASNSHKSKEQTEEKQEIVINKPELQGQVKVKKEPLSRKFGDIFLADGVGSIKDYVIFEILVPAIKDTIVDVITNGTNMLFYNQPNARRTSRGGSRTESRTSYTSYYRDRDSRESRKPVRPAERHGFQDIIFDNRGDAQEVMECLLDVCDHYNLVSIATYYELAKVPELATYTDNDYGWYNLTTNDMAITRDRDGYRIKLPKPEPLN